MRLKIIRPSECSAPAPRKIIRHYTRDPFAWYNRLSFDQRGILSDVEIESLERLTNGNVTRTNFPLRALSPLL